jgi:tRNA-splicing ligase RtcB
VTTALARLRQAEDVQAIAVMPDVHLAREVCVGTVLATANLVYPGAVGGDIGCGMAAVAFDVDASVLHDRDKAAAVLVGLGRRVPVMSHHDERAAAEALFAAPLSAPALERVRDRQAARQLGTLGRGNHFIELQTDDQGRLWGMVHSGSRGIGQAIRDHHVRACVVGQSGLAYLDAREQSGQAYLDDMRWAMAYADENRRRLIAAVAEVIADVVDAEIEEDSLVLCNHNHIERIVGPQGPLWLHRKGAISARADEPGLIPGSMGTASFHVVGRGHADALWSSSHGAGRRMSRTEARRSISRRAFERQTEGVWLDRRKTDGLLEEAPGAYKDIDDVMATQRELTRIVRRLKPVISYKGT